MLEKISNEVTSGFQPKYIHQNLDIARATQSAARLFNLGGKPTRLTLDTRPRRQMALVNRFNLDESTSRKLGRGDTIVESIASPIIKRSSLAEINNYLTRLRVNEELRETANFYFVSARRRAEENANSSTLLSGRHKIVKEAHIILGIVQQAGKLFWMIIPSGRGGVTVVDASSMTNALEEEPDKDDSSSDSSHENSENTTMTYPDDPTQDFAVCYSECLSNVPAWIMTPVAGICGACVTMVGIAAATGGSDTISVPVLAVVCTGCVAAVGAVLGNCVLMCHEMFGE